MLIDRTILNKHLHEAAVEQFAGEYEGKGYEVTRTATVGEVTVDLLVQKGDDVKAFDFKVNDPKQRTPGFALGWMDRVRGQLGKGQLHLVYVPYPSATEVDVPELDEALLRWVRERYADDLDAIVPDPKQVWVKRLELDKVIVETPMLVEGRAVLGLAGPAPAGPGETSPQGREVIVEFSLRTDAAFVDLEEGSTLTLNTEQAAGA